ncbi:MAG: heavy metal translocating P-type ATPase [Synergistes sp.]|nr:heavy metal translocating P-type ATPase [Synergistes sp.]
MSEYKQNHGSECECEKCCSNRCDNDEIQCEKEHHHVHGHDGACRCSACQMADDIFEENEEEIKQRKKAFIKEVTFLAAVAVIFIPALICEEAFPDLIPEKIIDTVFIILYIITGWPVLKIAVHSLLHGDIFNEFTLMGGASLAALVTGEMSESVGVMIFYRLGEAFQEAAAANSRTSIKALIAQKPMTAKVIRDGEIFEIAPEEIIKGDMVRVMPDEVIPTDGYVVNGEGLVDVSAITGEAIPVSVSKGSEVYGGTLSKDGMLIIEAAGAFETSTISRVLEMVRNSVEHKAPTERFITRFCKIYTPVVFFIAAAVMIIPPLIGKGTFGDYFYRGLVMLVISCPCALVISIPLGYFGGIGAASKHGILVKGGYAIDAVCKVVKAVFDKTGTLTDGKFKVNKIIPADGVSREELLNAAAYAETGSTHAVARSVLEVTGEREIPDGATITQIPGHGMVYRCGSDTVAAGNGKLMSEYGVPLPETKETETVVYVAKNNKFLGTFIVGDSIRPECENALKKLRKNGIREIYMLSGDREEPVKAVSETLHLDGYRAKLLPGEKVQALHELCGGDPQKAIYVGDGVNDGPVLVTSGTGVAMGGFGSRVAIEVADVVVLDDSLTKVVDLIRISKKTRLIVWENVALALGVKLFFMVFGIVGVAGLWEAVFADVGVALLAILNATRASRID